MRFLLVVVAWNLLWLLARVLEYAPHASLWYPPAGLSLALYLVYGWRAFPLVAAGAFMAALQGALFYDNGAQGVGLVLVSSLGYALTHGLGYGLGVALVRRLAGGLADLRDPKVSLSLLLAAPVTGLLAAIGGTRNLALFGGMPWEVADSILVGWAVGDTVGALALGPALAHLLLRVEAAGRGFGWPAYYRDSDPAQPAGRGGLGLPLLLLLFLAAGLAGYGLHAAVEELRVSVMVYLAVVPLMLLAVVGGETVTLAAVALFSLGLAVLTRLLGLHDQAFDYQMAMMMMAAVGYFALTIPKLRRDALDLRLQLAASRRARTEAERAQDRKSFLLRTAGHDLRQPLQAVGLYLEALEAGADPARTLGRAKASVQHLGDLLTTILDNAKLDAGLIDPVVQRFPLAPMLERLAMDFTLQAEAKGLSLRWVPSSQSAVSDPVLLESMLRNLMQNALRYTPAGRLLLGVRRRGMALEIQVCDTGKGIEPQDHARIFQDFTRLQPDLAAGHGIGLSVVRRFAELLGHPLSVQSVPGRGSVFSIRVPRG